MANILVVDDEIGIRELLMEILGDEGYAVQTAENAAVARQLVESQVFDLILLDIWMPDADGVTLLKELGARKMLTCPVIMMSGHGTIETAVEATRFGALAFLEKPIAMKKLLDTVKHGLEVRNRILAMAKYRPPEEPPRPVSRSVAPPPPQQSLPCFTVPGTGVTIDFNLSLKEVREMTERAYLLALMNFEACQMTRVARRAGLERTHLYRKLKALGMEIPRGHAAAAPAAPAAAEAGAGDASCSS
ncbi:MAG: response regulator [Duodenibacillus sp.]|nr:response regulator [Duodenibacillus sp.]